MDSLNYQEWIERERRVRIKILQSSPVIQKDRVCRICNECEEICLCHEEACPNCNASNIDERKLDFEVDDGIIKDRIRCEYRFTHLSDEQNSMSRNS